MKCAACGRWRLLDGYSGEGGAGRGYQLAGFCVTPLDNSEARLANYPTDCLGATPVMGDAIEYLLNNARRYAVVHTSPPCTGYSRGTAALPDRLERYDRLIAATREVLIASGRPYVIENVEDAKRELDHPLTLCWTHFRAPGSVLDDDGAPLWMRRHRLFESNVTLWPADQCYHPATMRCAGAYGGARRDAWEAKHVRKGGYVPQLGVMRALLETPWMSEKGCQLSIPPFYTEHLGHQLIEYLEHE